VEVVAVKVWLDLEETIINNFDDGLFLGHVYKIKKWLDQKEIKEVNIWSFAIWDDKDIKSFEFRLKEEIELALGRPIISYPSVEQMQKLVYHYESIEYDSRSDFMQLNGKRWSFIKYCLGNQYSFEANECVLIDDAVPNQTLVDYDRNLTIQLINVLNLK
jgi:hypothetical protein